MAHVEFDREGVNQALARLLAWPDIARSPQLANFLSYIVERRLNNDTQSIKAYSIAVDVFGRPADFDPQADPIVRVQARRLRSLLDQYYQGAGAGDKLRILLPIGRYVPDFVEVEPEPPAPAAMLEPDAVVDLPTGARRRGQITLPWFVLLVLTLGASVLTYALTGWDSSPDPPQVAQQGGLHMPRLRIMEFQNLTGDAMLTPQIAALAVELVADFEPLIVVEPIFGGRAGNEVVGEDDDFALTGVVRKDPADGGMLQFNAILTDLASNTVIWDWSAQMPVEQIAARDGIADVSQQLILRLGGPRGPLHIQARDYLARTDITGQENLYVCGLLFIAYRSEPSANNASRFQACTDALSPDVREGPNVLAGRASVLFETAPVEGDERSARFDEAAELLRRALQIAPTSSFAWEQYARLQEALGEHEEAEAAYGTSLQLNTANIDASAARARHMALTGQLAAAVPLAQRAIDAVPASQVPHWFYCVPALVALEDNYLDRAARLADSCGRVDVELGTTLAIVAGEKADDANRVGQVLPMLLEVASFRTAGIMTRMRTRVTDERLLAEFRTALLSAGVPEQRLDNRY